MILVWYSILEIFFMLFVRYFINFFLGLSFSVWSIFGFSIFVLINSMVLFCLDVIFNVRFVVVKVLFFEGWLLVIIIMLGFFSVFESGLNVFVNSFCLIFWYFLLICFCLLFNVMWLFFVRCLKLIWNGLVVWVGVFFVVCGFLDGVCFVLMFFFLWLLFICCGVVLGVFIFLWVFKVVFLLGLDLDCVFCFLSVFLMVFFIIINFLRGGCLVFWLLLELYIWWWWSLMIIRILVSDFCFYVLFYLGLNVLLFFK